MPDPIYKSMHLFMDKILTPFIDSMTDTLTKPSSTPFSNFNHIDSIIDIVFLGSGIHNRNAAKTNEAFLWGMEDESFTGKVNIYSPKNGKSY